MEIVDRRNRRIEYAEGELVGEVYFIKDILAPDFKRRALFKCKCGNSFDARLDHVRGGRIVSCGCFQKERQVNANTRHGGTYTAEYKSWCAMKGRCYNPNDAAYENYGGRGITVCERWRESFENFLEDMGNRPSLKHSLDRIEVNGIYDKPNCRWADMKTQSNNRRVCFLELNGVKKSVTEWAAQLGISKQLIAARKCRGLTVDKILKSI